MKNTFFSMEFGSSLYGCHTKDSDSDILHIYAQSDAMLNSLSWSHHNFQYKEDGVDHVFSTVQNLIRNIIKGDSTVNYECLFSKDFQNGSLSFLSDYRNDFSNYSILKAYLGIVKRDLKIFKQENNSKRLYHAMRGLWSYKLVLEKRYKNEIFEDASFYDKLMRIKKGEVDIKEMKAIFEKIQKEIETLRANLNEKLNSGLINRYFDVEKLKKIDHLVMEFCKSDLYLSYANQIEVFDGVYTALEKDVVYEK